MDSPGTPNEWPSDLAAQVEELNSEAMNVDTFQNIPSNTLTEEQVQIFSQPGFNFSVFQTSPAPIVSQQNSGTHDEQVVDIHAITESFNQQLQGLSKEFSGWQQSTAKEGASSTVILNIDGTPHEIPISFHLDSDVNIDPEAITGPNAENDGDLTREYHSAISEECKKLQDNEDNGCVYFPVSEISNSASLSENTETKRSIEDKSLSEAIHCHNSDVASNIEQEEIEIPDSFITNVKPNCDQINEIPIIQEEVELHNIKVRKSARLVQKLEESSPIIVTPYHSDKEYNTTHMWCEDCQKSYEDECDIHKLQTVEDKLVLSRAWSSLPSILQIFRLEKVSDIGVFSKKFIPKRTQFGPFIGELWNEKTVFEESKFPLAVELEEGMKYIDASDENKCNWMMFVRPAENYVEQNLIVYQYQDEIYFNSIRDIHPKEELKIWYAAPYAKRIGKELHSRISQPVQEGKFECSECEEKFKSTALLQKHVIDQHDEDNSQDYDVKDSENTFAAIKQEGELTNDSFQSWKKKKRNIYFNKIKKYKTYKRQADAKKKAIKADPNEWKCKNCDFTFDSAAMLNLHTLTHAAEAAQAMERDLEEANQIDALSRLSAAAVQIHNETQQQKGLGANGVLDSTEMKCPCCEATFSQVSDLIKHTLVHARPARKRRNTRRNRVFNPDKPHQCKFCIKSFSTEERLIRHNLVHSVTDSEKPLTCQKCNKKFLTNPALACHMKTHSDEKYYQCPICREGFDQMKELKIHGKSHGVDGIFPCTHCHKAFPDFNPLRKHIRSYHPYKELPCPHCNKVFPRSDKLKLHMLKHTNIKEYMCDICGRQFKRKDKLKEHTKRMHDPANPKVLRTYSANSHPKAKFIPRVQPTDYDRFIYKCHSCMLGFKRRGMLVNHLAKRHPTIKPTSIPELNLPILRTQRDFFCQYCDKVYKSSTKRKAHILKAHPGAELPPSGRLKTSEYEGIINNYGINSATYSQLTGSIAASPHQCPFCHKQYASKPKLFQHIRKDHPSKAQPPKRVHHKLDAVPQSSNNEEVSSAVPITNAVDATYVLQQPEGQAADLLTQAMSELTQSFTTDYSPHAQAQLQVTNDLQLNIANVPSNKSRNANIFIQPTVLQTNIGAANIELTPILQDVNSQELENENENLQEITIVHGNESQTLSVPVALANQLISRSFFVNKNSELGKEYQFVTKL